MPVTPEAAGSSRRRDIVGVCERAQVKRWHGEVENRYNGWMTLDLDSARANGTIKAAKSELAAL
jgi:hypothetical protein